MIIDGIEIPDETIEAIRDAKPRRNGLTEEQRQRKRERDRKSARRRYAEHREEITARQRERYATDPEYRQRKIEAASRYNKAKKTQK